MDERDETLLMILGKTDAIFWPVRGPAGGVLAFERRRDFLTAGVPWTSGGTGARAWQAGHRGLEELRAAGLVATFNPRGRTLGARLTEATDDAMRFLAGLPTYADALALLDRLYALRDDPGGFDAYGAAWTTEEALARADWSDEENRWRFVALMESFLPLAWRGLAESNASTLRHVSYCLTPAGLGLARKRAKAGLATGAYPPPLPDGDLEAWALYDRVRREEIQALECGTPADPSELGIVPLPARPTLRKWQRPGPRGTANAPEPAPGPAQGQIGRHLPEFPYGAQAGKTCSG